MPIQERRQETKRGVKMTSERTLEREVHTGKGRTVTCKSLNTSV